MSQEYDGSVKVKVEVDTEQSKKDFSTVEKQAEQAGQAAASSYSKAGKSAEDAGKGFGKLQSSAVNAAVAVGRGGTVATTTAASIANQTAVIAKQTLAYNAVTKAAAEAALAEQKAAQSEVASLSSRLAYFDSVLMARHKEANSTKISAERRRQLTAIEKEASVVADQLAKAENRLAVANTNMGVAIQKPLGAVAALRAGFSGLLQILGGPIGIAITAVATGVAYLTGKAKTGTSITEKYTHSISGLEGTAEQAAKGISSLRQEIAAMSQEQAAYFLKKTKDATRELFDQIDRFKKLDDNYLNYWGRSLGYADTELNKVIDTLKQGSTNFDAFSRAAHRAADAGEIDEKQLEAILKVGKSIVSNTVAMQEYEKRSVGASSAVSEALRQIDEAAKPQNIKEAYAIFNRYIDSQDKGKKTATEAAKESARLAVERMKEAWATQMAAAAAARLAESQAISSGDTQKAENFSKLAQTLYADAARFLSDAAKLEAKIPEIKIGGGSGGAKKELTEMSVFLEKFKADLAALRGESGADFTKGLQDGLKGLRSELKSVKGATKEVREGFEKEYTQAFVTGKIKEFTREIMELEGRTRELTQVDIENKVKTFGEVLKKSGEDADAAAAGMEKYRKLLESKVEIGNLQEEVDFLKEVSQLGGDYGLAIEKQNQLIERQAELYRELFKGKPELLEMVDIWERLSKREASNKWEGGFSRAAKKYSAEWTNAAKVAEQTFGTTISGMENIGMSAFDALFDNAEFRADQLLKDMARQLYQIGLRSAIGSIFKFGGFSDGGYTGDGSTKDVAGVVHGQEFVINAAATKSIGVSTLNALNSTGSLSSLYSRMPLSSGRVPANGGTVVNVNVENHTSSQVEIAQKTNNNGGMDIGVLITSAVANDVTRGGQTWQAIQGRMSRMGNRPSYRV